MRERGLVIKVADSPSWPEQRDNGETTLSTWFGMDWGGGTHDRSTRKRETEREICQRGKRLKMANRPVEGWGGRRREVLREEVKAEDLSKTWLLLMTGVSFTVSVSISVGKSEIKRSDFTGRLLPGHDRKRTWPRAYDIPVETFIKSKYNYRTEEEENCNEIRFVTSFPAHCLLEMANKINRMVRRKITRHTSTHLDYSWKTKIQF